MAETYISVDENNSGTYGELVPVDNFGWKQFTISGPGVLAITSDELEDILNKRDAALIKRTVSHALAVVCRDDINRVPHDELVDETIRNMRYIAP